MADKQVQVQVKRRLNVIPDRAFGALTDPLRAKSFMFATDKGKMTHVEIDPKVGGKYIFIEERDGTSVEHLGQFLKVERPRLLEFELRVEKYSEHTNRVRIEIESLGHWSEITVTHFMHADFADDIKIMESGWNDILDKMARTIE